jgi:cytochrome c oxidase subunit IV
MSEHIVPLRTYLKIFAALVLLTITTVGVDYIDIGAWNLVAAISIASIKALLVALYFMHLRYSERLTWVFVGVGILWLTVLIGITFDDVITRRWDSPPQHWPPATTLPSE